MGTWWPPAPARRLLSGLLLPQRVSSCRRGLLVTARVAAVARGQTKGDTDEGCGVPGPFELAVEDVDDPRIEAARRRGHPHHDREHLRFGPAPLRGAGAAGGGDGARAREHGHRQGGRARREPGQGRRPGVGAVQPGLRHLPQLRRRGGRRPACAPTRPGSPAPGTGTRRWARTGAGRPSTCACRGPTSTCSSCRRGPSTSADFTMLSDIFPTGYHGTELAGVEPGRTVAIFGAGPVGLMAALSANLRGAAQTFVVDFQPDRLALAEKMGATPVNLAEVDADRGDHGRHRRVRRRLRRRGSRLPGPRPGRAGAPRTGPRRRWSRWSGPPARSAWSACTSRPTRAPPPRTPSKAATASTTAPPSPRASPSGRASARSCATTAGCATSSSAARPRPRRSSRTSCPWTRRSGAYDQFDKRAEGWTKVILHP